MNNKHIVSLYYMPDYWENFLNYCNDVANRTNQAVIQVIQDQLNPNGKYIDGGLGNFLRWDDEKHHTLFVLKWS